MYNRFGVMIDCSRNAVMKVEQVKKFIDCIKKMGYNTLELYTEDTYEIEGEPWFGYMRGAYSAEEIKEIDNYAIRRGVELIPCIQTLAHLPHLFTVPAYHEVHDVRDILLVDEPKTYELIEKMIKTCAENFTSRTINIGMDEAGKLGLGRYLKKHGISNKYELLARHLNKVCEIASKYGFHCTTWSDMFFGLEKQDYTGFDLGNGKRVNSLAELMPQNVDLVYWNYYDKEKDNYDKMIVENKKFGRNVWFAGGAWSWNGFAPHNDFTLATMKPAMQSVIEHGIRDVLITMWGDDGKECSFYSLLPSLYAIRQYADGNFDENSIKEGFRDIFGYDYEEFILLDLPNSIAHSGKICTENASKVALYSDCFLGVFQKNLEALIGVDYEGVAERLQKIAEKNGEYSYLFDCMSKLCAVVSVKKDLGLDTRRAYRQADRKKLNQMPSQFDVCRRRLQDFYYSFKSLWMIENKSFGWEEQDYRLGALMRRLQSCKERVMDYLEGRIDYIEELEIEPMLYTDELICECNEYTRLLGPCGLDFIMYRQ